jgi:uncharacterized protein
MPRAARGIGLQYQSTVAPIHDGVEGDEEPLVYDVSEILCDSFTGPLDGPYVAEPATRPLIERLRAEHALIAHGNYGEEFGFTPLAETNVVRRHIPFSQELQSPWYGDHLFYGFEASTYMWSSPLPFSRAEIERVAGRAAELQDRLKAPLLHENPFYYAPFPGSHLGEAEFIAGLVERAQTYLLLDLHNIYANSVNFKGYDCAQYLRTIPLDRVIEVHLAGGQWIDGWYHDLHNHPVPEPVWEMLAHVLRHARNLQVVTLEVQGPAHHSRSRAVDASWRKMIRDDLARARALWTSIRGAL